MDVSIVSGLLLVFPDLCGCDGFTDATRKAGGMEWVLNVLVRVWIVQTCTCSRAETKS